MNPEVPRQKRERYHLRTLAQVELILILVLLAVGAAQCAAGEDTRPVVNASEILEKIENGVPVVYDGVIVEGDLNLSEIVNSSYDEAIPLANHGNNTFIIKDGISIQNSLINGTANFSKTTFQGPVEFNGTVFNKESLFLNTNFDENADFRRAVFGDSALFRSANFSQHAWFDKSEFNSSAIFNDADFVQYASFGKVKFYENAEFRRNEFHDGVSFLKTEFSGDAYFNSIIIHKGAIFEMANFSKKVRFSNATFRVNAEFSSVNFGGDVYFNVNEIHNLILTSMQNKKFTYLNINFDKSIHFVHCDEHTYQIIRKSLEDNGQFRTADNFHYKYRKCNGNHEGATYYAHLYSCGFGVRPDYTIATSTIIVIIFGTIFWIGDGVQKSYWYYKAPKRKSCKILNFDLCIYMPQKCSLNNLIESLYFSLLVFTFQSRSHLRPRGWYKYIAILEGVFGLIFFGLFIATMNNVITW